jgi:hypothetical protein
MNHPHQSFVAAIVHGLCFLTLSFGQVIASPYPVTDRVSVPFDPPPLEEPILDLPEGSVNLAANAPVTGSHRDPIEGTYKMVTDGHRGAWESPKGTLWADDGHYVEYSDGKQYVQIDLQNDYVIDAVWIWQRHACEGYEVPSDVIVQIASDESFATSIKTVFNCDSDNSMGFGHGKDPRYATSRYGKLIPVAEVFGRYIRVWSCGGARTELNMLVEVEVYGREKSVVPRLGDDRLNEAPRERRWFWVVVLSAVVLVACCIFHLLTRFALRRSKVDMPPKS